MLNYKDIIDSFTLKLSEVFSDVEIYTDDTVNGFDKSCFYVQLIPLPITSINKNLDRKDLFISIKYYQEARKDKMILYEMLNDLNNNLNRGISCKDRYLKFEKIEPNILKDEIGYYLDYLIKISYFDDVYTVKKEYETMQNIELNLNVKEMY